ncbi:unnamed protein product [Durusdinium trenchii]|uniref:Uncharacterized protein n=1 Tax=Durusdinium trenchii TaxID=1381693 RepID=A0ABP0L237_9DINO
MVTQSDRPFRRLVRAHGCTLCYTEMLMADRFAQCEDFRLQLNCNLLDACSQDYALRLQAAGCALLAVHGRRLESAKERRGGAAAHCLQLDAEECFSVWDLRNVDVLRNHLRSMLTGAVGSEEAEEGTQRLLTDLRDRARGRYILEWWRLQQAGSWSCEARGSTTR